MFASTLGRLSNHSETCASVMWRSRPEFPEAKSAPRRVAKARAATTRSVRACRSGWRSLAREQPKACGLVFSGCGSGAKGECPGAMLGLPLNTPWGYVLLR